MFGVAPGVKHLGYVVLEYNGTGRCRPLDGDILSGKRLLAGNPNRALLRKKFHAHQLILDTVWERHWPVAMAIGPPADASESPLNAELAAVVLSEVGRITGVTVVRATEAELGEALGVGRGRTLKTAVTRSLTTPLGSRNRILLLAAAAGLYAVTAAEPGARLLGVGT